jgi:ribosomal-protein-alanine N-acetyltransferase
VLLDRFCAQAVDCGGSRVAEDGVMLPLESPRLALRPFATSDAPAFAAYRADPAVARYQGWESCTLAEAVAFIRRQRRQRPGAPGRWTQIALALRESDALIGDLGLYLHAGDSRQATIGVTLAPAYQGRGYAAEALTTLLDHLFRQMDLHRAAADVDPRNRPSWTLLERLGMRREGHRVRSVWFKGEWADEYLYAILREEWLARQGRIDTDLAHQTL